MAPFPCVATNTSPPLGGGVKKGQKVLVFLFLLLWAPPEQWPLMFVPRWDGIHLGSLIHRGRRSVLPSQQWLPWEVMTISCLRMLFQPGWTYFQRSMCYRTFLEACAYGQYECSRGASCFPNNEGKGGTCRCEPFFGFQGLTCDEYSAASWLLFVLNSASMVHFCYTLWVRSTAVLFCAGCRLPSAGNPRHFSYLRWLERYFGGFSK